MATDFDRGEEVQTLAVASADAVPRPVEAGAARSRRRAPKNYAASYVAIGTPKATTAARARVVDLLADLLGRG